MDDALAQLDGGDQLCGLGLAHRALGAQLAEASSAQPSQTVELRQNPLGDGDDVLSGRPGAQEDSDELGVGQRFGAAHA